MPIIDSIKIARKRGTKDGRILQEIIKQNPEKGEFFQDYLKKGINPTQILEKIIKENIQVQLPPLLQEEKEEPPAPPVEVLVKEDEGKAEEEKLSLKKTTEDESKRLEEARKRVEMLKKRLEEREGKKQIEPPPMPTQNLKVEEKKEEMPSAVPGLRARPPAALSPDKKTPFLVQTAQPAPSLSKPIIPLSPSQKPPIEIIRPVPLKPSFREKLWIRLSIFGLVLVVLTTISTFWYWYLVIRVRPPIPLSLTPEPTITQQAGATPTPGVEPTILPSLFSVEDTRILPVSSDQELPSLLKQTVNEAFDKNQFRRIVIKNTAENKILGLRDFFEATLIRVPEELYQKLEDDLTLFVYSQLQGNRIGVAVRIKNLEGLEDLLKAEESTMETDFQPFFELVNKQGSAIVPYFRNASNVFGYKGPNFRYQTLSQQDVGICYLISNDYFVFTSSWTSMEKTINKLGLTGAAVELIKDLKIGDTGPEVELLQTWLKQDPAIYPQGAVTGTFGANTKAAVVRFQQKYASEILAPQGLTEGNGIVDQYTRIKLNELYSKAGVIPTKPEITKDLRFGDHGNEVKLLQTWLAKDKDVYPEAIVSGWFGYATKNAVIRFQEKYASEILAPQQLTKGTGIVDGLTRKKLNELYGK